MGLPRIIVTTHQIAGHQIVGPPRIIVTTHQILGLLMIMLIYQQRSTENNPILPSESTLNNNSGNVQGENLVNSILAVHNQERAAVGVQPLTWSDTLAAGAQTWAQHLATIRRV